MSFQTCCWRGYLPGCFNAPNFPLVLPTYTLQLLSLSVSCRLLSRNYVQTRRDLSTGQRPARNVMHLEQIWGVECLLLGLHAQKKQCFVLNSWWIITVTTKHGATCANRKMRPDDLLMHHEVRFGWMFLPDVALYNVGLRLKASESSQHCK